MIIILLRVDNGGGGVISGQATVKRCTSQPFTGLEELLTFFFNKSNPEKCRELVVKVVFGLHSNTPTLHLPSSPPLPISQIKPQAPV